LALNLKYFWQNVLFLLLILNKNRAKFGGKYKIIGKTWVGPEIWENILNNWKSRVTLRFDFR